MNKLWKFVNQPLVVAILSIVIVFVFLFANVFRIFSLFDEDPRRRNEIEALGRLQLVSFAESQTPTNAPQKYVGTLRNNSSFIVHDIEAAICTYDADGELKDVISRKLEGIGALPPDQERKFYVDRTYDWDSRSSHYLRIEADETTISFVATGTTETED